MRTVAVAIIVTYRGPIGASDNAISIAALVLVHSARKEVITMQINDWLTLASLALQAARLVPFSLGRRPAWQATAISPSRGTKKRGSTQ